MSVQIERHPEERGRRRGVVLPCGCSCCCCCCLHTIGGIVGAGVASRSSTPEASRTVRGYWISVLVVAAAAWILGATQGENPVVATMLVLMIFPLVQLAASLLALLILPLAGPWDGRKLGELTWKSFLYGAVGFGIMLGGLLLLTGGFNP